VKIGIVGAGNIGTALTHLFTARGHDVAVANSRDPETLADLVRLTGARAVRAAEAPAGAQLVIITIPEKNVVDLPDDLLAHTAPGAVVVDTGNYYPQGRDGRIDAIEDGRTESGWVADQLGHTVIKAFNNIQAEHLLKNGTPAGTGGRIALPIAGDDAAAKALVMELVDDIGFDPVDAGGLDQSWRQQPGTAVYATDLDAEGVRTALAAAVPGRSPEWSA
jgi:8-hydroxy-5-deazaflavin:NADPH oxidoreductase